MRMNAHFLSCDKFPEFIMCPLVRLPYDGS